MPSHKHKRAPSVDMTSIGLRNASAPAPTYSSIFRSQDHSYMLHQMYEPPAQDHASKRPCLSNARTGTIYAPALSQEETLEVDEKSFPVKSEPHSASRPHRTESSPFASIWPSLPARAHPQSRKRISIPWILALVFCLTLLWFISIALGAGLFSAVYSEPASPVVQKIYLVINDQVLSISMPAATSPDTANVTIPAMGLTTTSVLPSTNSAPTPTKGSVPESTPSQDSGDKTKEVEAETSKPKRSVDIRPTGFVTLART